MAKHESSVLERRPKAKRQPTRKHKVGLVKFTPQEVADDLPAELDFSELTPVIGRGVFAREISGAPALIAKYVIADESSLTCTLEDERKITVPLGWYPRLGYATPAERNDWRLIMGGRAVNWRRLGLAISIKALFEGTKANESAASLKKWLGGRGGR